MSRLLTADEVAKFEKILAEYSPNNKVLEAFRASKFCVIAGPAGAGKDTLRSSLIKQHPVEYLPILSTTTRPPRQGETDGAEYHFAEIEQMEKGLARHEFFQAAMVHNQQISSLHVNEIRKLTNSRIGLSILIVSIEAKLRAIKPDIKTVFLIPPNYQSLIDRMNENRKLEEPEIIRRLQAAKAEIIFTQASANYYCLVSDTVQGVTDAAHGYFHHNAINPDEDARARAAMKEILSSLNI